MRDLAGYLTGEVRLFEAELLAVCDLFGCPPSVALEQDRETVDRLLALRRAERVFSADERDLSEGDRALLDGLIAAAPEPRRFVARHARLQRGRLPTEGAK